VPLSVAAEERPAEERSWIEPIDSDDDPRAKVASEVWRYMVVLRELETRRGRKMGTSSSFPLTLMASITSHEHEPLPTALYVS